jgi:hypothetical protein
VGQDVGVGQERWDEAVLLEHLFGLLDDQLEDGKVQQVVVDQGADADDLFALVEAVDAAVALLEPVRVPWQLVVNQGVRDAHVMTPRLGSRPEPPTSEGTNTCRMRGCAFSQQRVA